MQELIAPTSVEFYARDWAAIGTKAERYREISRATTSNADVPTHNQPIDAFSAAEKLSWAAHREAMRQEDETYCLLGILEFNMPISTGKEGVGPSSGYRQPYTGALIYNSMLDHSLFLFSRGPYG